jgi:hypothetical protein
MYAPENATEDEQHKTYWDQTLMTGKEIQLSGLHILIRDDTKNLYTLHTTVPIPIILKWYMNKIHKYKNYYYLRSRNRTETNYDNDKVITSILEYESLPQHDVM